MRKTALKHMKGVIVNEGINRRVIKLFASPESIIKRNSFAMGVTIIEPGNIHEVHQHYDNQEIVFVWKGKGIANIGDITTSLEEGDIFGIDYGEPHGFSNTSKEVLILLWIYSPAGLADEKFLIDN